MTMNKNHNCRWRYAEIDSLYREYELLELTPEEIAEKHQRTVTAILFRLKKEGIIDCEARNGWQFNPECGGWNNPVLSLNNKEDDDSDYDNDCNNDSDDDDLEKLNDNNDKFQLEMNGRIYKLEESMFDMKTMVASILKKISQTNNRTRPHLRNYDA